MTAEGRTPGSDPPPRGGAASLADAAEHDARRRPDGIRATAAPASLRQILDLRSVAIAGQALAVAAAVLLGVSLPVVPMATIIAALVVLNIASSARLRRGTPVTQGAVAAQLGLDLAAFTALLLLAGGTANPVAVVYLLHVVVITTLLPWRIALAGTGLVIASLTLAVSFAEPLRYADGQPLPEPTLAVGLWISLVLTAVVTAWFVIRIVASLREHEHLLQDAARQALRDEVVTRIGALAAGAAHELGTPLMTMAMVVGEMQREAEAPGQRRDAATLAAQIDACRQALANLRAAAGHARAEGGGPAALDAFLSSVTAQFCAMRPEVPLQTSWEGPVPAPEIFADETLRQSLLILLNNAADASPRSVDVTARWDDTSLCLTVADRGSGIPPENLDLLGRAFFTTKAPGQGTGLGLVLTASTVGRLGGTVRWTNRSDGGLLAEIRLPLNRLLLSARTP